MKTTPNSFTFESTAATPILAFPHQGRRDLFGRSLIGAGAVEGKFGYVVISVGKIVTEFTNFSRRRVLNLF